MQSHWMIVASLLFAPMGVCIKVGGRSTGPGGAWIAIVLIIASGAAVSLASRQTAPPVLGTVATEGGRRD